MDKEKMRLFTVKQFAKKNEERGTWPSSEAAIWALRAGAPENGFGDVFISIGRRVLIDEEKFWTAVAYLQEAKNEMDQHKKETAERRRNNSSLAQQ